MIIHEVVVTLDAADDFQPSDAVVVVETGVRQALDELAARHEGKTFRASLREVRAQED